MNKMREEKLEMNIKWEKRIKAVRFMFLKRKFKINVK